MRTSLLHRALIGFGLSLALASAGCGDDSSGSDDDGGTDTVDADPNAPDADPNAPDADTTVSGDGGPCVPQDCSGHVTECLDCVDNDNDGLIDSADPECLGPCDNTEGPALTAGIGGEGGNTCKRDCYFDFGNGPGNDDCHWDHQCDPEQPRDECPYDEQGVMDGDYADDCPDVQSELCHDVCEPLTPNGCDCFGCCQLPGVDYPVYIGTQDGNSGTCTFADIDDPEKCRPCTQVSDCTNECETCELCLGETELPDECTDEERCDPGVQACGLPGDEPCADGFFCVTGCCQAIID